MPRKSISTSLWVCKRRIPKQLLMSNVIPESRLPENLFLGFLIEVLLCVYAQTNTSVLSGLERVLHMFKEGRHRCIDRAHM